MYGYYKPGLPSEHASRRIDDFYPAKLLKIPDNIPDEIATTLPIAGFTSYGMIRKVITPKAKVLVTAAKSNTSLSVISALKNFDVDVYAMTTSDKYSDVLFSLGVKEIITIDTNLNNFLDDFSVKHQMNEIGGFDVVIDPFFDIYLSRVINLMNYDAKYITCGLYDQFPSFAKMPFKHRGCSLQELLKNAMIRNVSIIGNCMGLREDGMRAIKDCQEGKFNPIIDSIYSEGEEVEFFERTYNFKDRIGKVVYMYKE